MYGCRLAGGLSDRRGAADLADTRRARGLGDGGRAGRTSLGPKHAGLAREKEPIVPVELGAGVSGIFSGLP